MRKTAFFTVFICCIILSNVSAQITDTTSENSKLILDHSVYNFWKKLENPQISGNGKWTSYEINPGKGDGILIIQNLEDNRAKNIPRGYETSISPKSGFAVFKIKTPEDTLRKYKSAKKKKEQMPKDSLGILMLNSKGVIDSVIKIADLKSYKMAKGNSNWIAFLSEPAKDKKDTVSKSDIEVYNLTVFNPVTDKRLVFDYVTEYMFSKEGNKLGFISLKKGKTDSSKVFFTDLEKEETVNVFLKKGYAKNLAIDTAGTQIAFIHAADTAKVKRYSLYRTTLTKQTKEAIVDTLTPGMTTGWEVNQNGKVYFSADGKRLFFGTAPKISPEPKDTLIDEEKFKVDIWNWQDEYLQTQQNKELEKTKQKNYLAVYNIVDGKMVQLEDDDIDEVRTANRDNSDFAIGISSKPYRKSSSWISPPLRDIYSVDVNTGEQKLITTEVQYGYSLSPGGNFITWFENADSSWYAYSVKNNISYSLTKDIGTRFHDEEYDKPNSPEPYGIAGWTTNDNHALIYDRYDIWLVSPDNSTSPERLTDGRVNKTSFRYHKTNNDSIFIGQDEIIFLKAVNEENWHEGFFKASVSKVLSGEKPEKLVMLDNKFVSMQKAKYTDGIIFQKSTYTEFPDLWSGDVNFVSYKRISDANPQQKNYLWGSVELIGWKGFEGENMKGLLYKPGNFDASKKYPMIVYFYEKYTDKLYAHYIPSPSRSFINFPLYNSNGYIIFIPDISYKTGYPGMSGYNHILSGAQYLADNFSFIDRNNIGLQGQSWGGYQAAFTVTRTDFFKAAMAGAPVSNMTSAYGGIRGESGVNRIFQYEREQSRIGGTLWEKFDLYVENSPLFKADKINTPLLIMANDNDGAVPWQQGIEFFVSLRRLGKPAWMLTYNGDEHNLIKWPNRVDLSIRMKQFFDHYLKGESMPEWMKDGIPAIQKGLINGYELK
jgi:dienelactone hydrolase